MSGRARVASSLVVLAAVTAGLVACGSNGTPQADTAHVAARATEPRQGDPTAAGPAHPNAAPSTAGNVSGSTFAATPSGTGTAAPSPSGASTAGNAGAPPEPASHGETASPAADPPKRISARHVLVQWMGSDRAGKSVLRTREQALVLAKEVLRRARAGEDLARLANEYSDEPNAGPRGGSLGRFGKGQMVGAFEQVAFKLEVGQISDIVETPFGFHVIQRTE